MVPTTSELEREVIKGNVRKYFHPEYPLVGYTYTFQCEMQNAWTDVNRWARGIVFDLDGNLVALPFPKFFNLGQAHETQPYNLPKTPFRITRKEDGSLIIVFNYKGRWIAATKGSFTSRQAIWATDKVEVMREWLDANIPSNITLLFEGIYPENRIVVDYHGQDKLVFLSAYDSIGRYELPYLDSIVSRDRLAESSMYFELVPVHEFSSIEHALRYLECTQGTDIEGFVVRYRDGLRVKLKSEDYRRIHKLISCSTPLSIWESFDVLRKDMKAPHVREEYWNGIPDEFLPDMKCAEARLVEKYNELLEEAQTAIKLAKFSPDGKPQSRKEICIYLKNAFPRTMHIAIKIMDGELGKAHKTIMDMIRPTGNVIA